MALTVAQGFAEFVQRVTPLESQRQASAKHRASVESSLKNALDVSAFRETGSFRHGTGVRNHCDVDLMVSIKGGRPGSSDTALGWVKSALQQSFPYTTVRISRPAVVVEFASGAEAWEITPGFLTSRGGEGVYIYDIPGPSSGWIDSAPLEHLGYVNQINGRSDVEGGAKELARLAKAWKYYNNVPISSFYLEMRAAKFMSAENSYVAIYDVCGLFEWLHETQLAAMNDPSSASGQFKPCSSDLKKADAQSKVKTAATRARKALNAHQDEEPATAFNYLDLLFGGKFPSR